MMFRRRKEKKTDYRQRLSLLRSWKPRMVVRRTNNFLHVQFVSYDEKGDMVVAEISSKKLRGFGWKAHCGNLPAAYLTGIIAAKEAKKKKIAEAVLDIGLHKSLKGSSIYACALGAKDGGLNINIGEKILPSKDMIRGRHIAEFAKSLKSNKEKYNRQFSEYIKLDLNPEDLEKHFEEIKAAIGSSLAEKEKISQEA